jgi:AcrR family transcriptional regulator
MYGSGVASGVASNAGSSRTRAGGGSGSSAAAPPARRTQAERRAESERQLLDAATELIAERGTTRASFAEIAARAGCSHGHPHYLFGTKTKMLEALVGDLAARFQDELLGPALAGRSGLAAVTECVRLFLASLDRPWPGTRALYVLMGEALGGSPELQPALNRYHADLRAMVAGRLVEAVQAGEVRPDVDPDAAATMIVGTVRGIGLQALSDPASVDVDAVVAETLESLTRSLAP